MEIDKVNVVNNDQIKRVGETMIKPGGSTIIGPSGSHGLKLSMNMTSQDKKAFLAKYEEWHKARKEKFTKKISLPNSGTANKPLQSLKNDEVKISELKKVKSSEQKQRESVFERLYKNVKKADRKTVNTSTYTISDVKTSEFHPKKFFVSKSYISKAELQNDPIEPDSCNDLNAKKSLNEEENDNKENELPVVLVKDTVTETKQKTCSKTFQESAKDSYLETIKEEFLEKNSPNLKNENLKLKNKTPLPKSSYPQACNKDNIRKPHCKAEKVGKPVRRSISMLYRKKMEMRRSVSEKNLSEIKLMTCKEKHNLQSQALTFEDILDNKNKLVNKPEPLFSPVKKTNETSNSLRNNLEDWLKSNGHSLLEYRHLRCFGISLNSKKLPDTFKKNTESYEMKLNTSNDENNKENIAPSETEEKHHEEVDVTQSQNWLEELHKLIVELKYSNEKCEEWLTAIKNRCPKCTQLPIYWECLAALNGSNGDMKSAIENYEKAIIEGAEVESIGDSLAELFDKMVIENQKPLGGKLDKGLNPCNIFKSTVIKFALQQKGVKESSKKTGSGTDEPNSKVVATPVRRSSRIRTPCNKDVVNSLQSLTPEVRKVITFKTNESLLN